MKETPSPNAVDALRKLEQDKGTNLSNAADMLLMLTQGLKKAPGVEIRKGRVTGATLDESKGWTVEVDQDGAAEDSGVSVSEHTTVSSARLVLCTGSSPTNQELPVLIDGLTPLILDTALSPSHLSNVLSKDEPITIAVVGASHSAVLVLLNLTNLALSSHPNLHIKWFTRHPLRYAEFMDGWILRDNTGLKGDAAAWAKANLEPNVFDDSPVSKVVTRIDYKREDEIETYKERLPGCKHYVQAIGYTRDPLPTLKRNGERGGELKPHYDHSTGGFKQGKDDKKTIPGLFGAGIAYPERVTDPHGNVEYAVGFWKFMKFVKRVAHQWA